MPIDAAANDRTVLVVEDDHGLNLLVCRQLKQSGFLTISAFSGKETIALLKERHIPVMLLDYQLPDMTGEAVVSAMKEAGITTLFVIMTGHGDERLAVAMMKMGASDYFVKETHFLDALPMVVNRLFSDAARDQKLRDAEAAEKRWLHESVLIADVSARLNGCGNTGEAYALAGKTVQELIGGYVVVSGYNDSGQAMLPREMFGFDGKIETVMAHIGFDIRTREIPLTRVDACVNAKYRSGRLEHIEGGVHALSAGIISKDACSAIEKHLDIDHVYTIGLVREHMYFGGVSVLVRGAIAEKHRRMIGTIVAQAAITINRIHAEKALVESEEKYRTLFDLESDAIVLSDAKSTAIIEVNSSAVVMYGYTRDELLAMRIVDLSDEPHATTQALQDGVTIIPMCRHRKKNGMRFFVEIMARHAMWNGRPVRIAAIRDITARMKMEVELKESKIIFDSFMEHSPIYVFFKDENIRSLRLSSNYEKMLGRPINELLGKSMDELFPSALSQRMVEDDKHVLLNGAPIEVIEELNGRIYRTIKFPIILEDKPAMLAGFTIDITEQQRSGRALIQSDKLKSIGVLSSGIAHEINQPLAAIALVIDYLLMKKRNGSLDMTLVGEKLNDMIQYIERMRGIIDEVRTFSREQGNERLDERFSVNDAVQGVLQLVTAQYRVHDIRLKVRLSSDTPPVRGNRYKIEQVILNILSNARDAVEERALSKPGFHPKNITIMTGIRNGAAAISVIDNGSGMSEDVKKNMFTPFFTTKEPGRGTGLGMSISFGLVKAMNGEIQFDSKQGYYTVFRILLPADTADNDATHDVAAGER